MEIRDSIMDRLERPDWKYYYEPDGYDGVSADYGEHLEKYCDHIESKLHAMKALDKAEYTFELEEANQIYQDKIMEIVKLLKHKYLFAGTLKSKILDVIETNSKY